MTLYIHNIKNDIKVDFCNHFTSVYIEDAYPGGGDKIQFICPQCNREYSLGGLHAWSTMDTPPENSVEATIVDDNIAESY